MVFACLYNCVRMSKALGQPKAVNVKTGNLKHLLEEEEEFKVDFDGNLLCFAPRPWLGSRSASGTAARTTSSSRALALGLGVPLTERLEGGLDAAKRNENKKLNRCKRYYVYVSYYI